MHPMYRRGSLMIEASFCLLPSILVILLNVELGRRASLEASLHYGVFQFVRHAVFGLSEREARRRVGIFFSRAYGPRGGPRPLHWRLGRTPDGAVEARLHYRFPMLLAWPGKHHFEITRRCSFCC